MGVWGRCPQKLKYNVKFRPLRNRLTTRFCRVLCIVCTILRYCWNIQIQGLFKDFQGPGIFFKIQGFLKDPMNPVCGSCLSTNTDKYTGSSETLFCLVFITDRRLLSTIHRRGPSLSGCRTLLLQSALRCLSSGHASRLIFLLFPIPVPDHVQCSRSDTFILDTLIVHVTYLLTFLPLPIRNKMLEKIGKIKSESDD